MLDSGKFFILNANLLHVASIVRETETSSSSTIAIYDTSSWLPEPQVVYLTGLSGKVLPLRPQMYPP